MAFFKNFTRHNLYKTCLNIFALFSSLFLFNHIAQANEADTALLDDMTDISNWYGSLKDNISLSQEAAPGEKSSMKISGYTSPGWIQKNLSNISIPIGSKLHFSVKGNGTSNRFVIYITDAAGGVKGFWKANGQDFNFGSTEWKNFSIDLVNEIPYEDSEKTINIPLNLNKPGYLKIYLMPGSGNGDVHFGTFWIELPPKQTARMPSVLLLNAAGEYGITQDLKNAGYEVAHIDYDRLSLDFLKQFNAVIVGSHPPEEMQTASKQALIKDIFAKYLEAGGGMLISHGGGEWDKGRSAINQLIKQFGAELPDEQITDPDHTYPIGYTKTRVFRLAYTTNITESPVTKNVKQIWYPAFAWRADGIKTALPLKLSPDWQIVVRGMPTAYSAKSIISSPIGEIEKTAATFKKAPPLMAIRNFKKGKLALLPVQGSFFLTGAHHPIWGNVVWSGNKNYSCDMDKLLLNTVKWLSESSQNNLGGYKNPVTLPHSHEGPQVLPLDWSKQTFPDTKNRKFYTGLFGAHTAFSDGQGGVHDFCTEAKKNGYDFIVFTEKFENLNPSKWEELKTQCKAESGPDFLAIPGMDYQDAAGNQYITWGYFPYPSKSILTPDGKRILYTYNFFQQNYSLLAITRLHSNPNYFKHLRHYSFMAVYTYKDGKLTENALPEYLSLAGDFYNPAPISLHQIYSPAEIAQASKCGLQTRVIANTQDNLKKYIQGPRRFYYFDQPCLIYLSSGPTLEYLNGINMNSWRPEAPGTEKWKMKFELSANSKISEIKIMDGLQLFRRFIPDERNFEKIITGYHTNQQNFVITAETEDGKSLISPSLKTLVMRQCYAQCADYQNYISSSFQKDPKGHITEMTGGIGNHYSGFNLFWTAAVNKDLKELFPPGWDGTLTCCDGLAAPVISFEKEGDIWIDFATTHNPKLISSETMIMEDCAVNKYPQGTPPRGDCVPTFKTIPTEFLDVKINHTAFSVNTDSPGFTLIEGEIKVKKDFTAKDGNIGVLEFHGRATEDTLNYFRKTRTAQRRVYYLSKKDLLISFCAMTTTLKRYSLDTRSSRTTRN